MKFPKTDDNERKHKNDANLDMVNPSFQTSASWEGNSMSSDPTLEMNHLRI